MARRIEIGRRERAVARESSVGRSSVKGIAAIVTVGLGFSVPRTAMIQGVCIYVSVVCCSVSCCPGTGAEGWAGKRSELRAERVPVDAP